MDKFVISAMMILVLSVSGFEKLDTYEYSFRINGTHDAIFGARKPNDTLVLQQHVIMEASQYGTSLKRNFFTPKNYLITQIKCLDQIGKNKGGFVSLIKDGSGYHTAFLQFQSQKNQTAHYIVQIFALECANECNGNNGDGGWTNPPHVEIDY